jgi:hypothetical protein
MIIACLASSLTSASVRQKRALGLVDIDGLDRTTGLGSSP